ncbi:hypothetical protein HC028_16690 [Planosporangium flavigriseum]|uniref:Uncharacterized protein n=1 Tax=Planosporangium flavigriseum TaxID=373681 RepID=A0A8J3LR99_9ACTN|nr:hypothetical protein [Planosporangium flavigriseum]NJC66129.1 hypothetical protein [Planosporangium flavigriseum]GIG75178.1 hypothetical protein Pfl04_35820 [Planosporangium flavigriseum]
MVARKTNDTYVTYDLGWVRMWRDDLAEVVQILSALGGTTTLSAGDYTLDSVDDLATLSQPVVSDFMLIVNQTRAVLTLDGRIARLEMKNPDLTARGAAAEVARVARRCQRRGAFFIQRRWLLGAVAILVLGATYAVIEALGAVSKSLQWSAVAVVAVLLIFNQATHGKPAWLRRAVIYTRTRSEAPPFWERKRDDIWIAVVSGFVFLVLGVVVGYVLPKS